MSEEFTDTDFISLEKENASRVRGYLHHFCGIRKCPKRSRMLTSFHWRKKMPQEFKDTYTISLKKINASRVHGY